MITHNYVHVFYDQFNWIVFFVSVLFFLEFAPFL
jgi:hypothetical protein